MAYTPPEYPAAIPDEVTDLPDRLDDIDWIEAARYNELKKELVAIMTELGTDPAGASTDVKTRLALLALIADPTFTGEATIPTISLTGGQIKFPAGVQASADVNTLDDYEEGIFTAALTCDTSGTITLLDAYKTMSYTKIGRLVTFLGYISVDSVDTPVGRLRLEGLPFTSKNGLQYESTMSISPSLDAGASTSIIASIANNASTAPIDRCSNGIKILDVAGFVSGASNFAITGMYIAA